MKNKLVFVPLIALMLTSCFKEDERMIPFDRGGKITATIGMTQTYKYQHYYSLEDTTIVGTNDKNSFDLVFENSAEKFGFYLNSANFSMAAPTARFNMSEVKSIAGLGFGFDASSAAPDSLVFKSCLTINGSDTLFSREVFVVDLGYDDLGNALGYRKITLDSIVGDTYFLSQAQLSDDVGKLFCVKKSGGSNFAYYSLLQNEQIYPEPTKSDYDLFFTQYTTLLFTNEGEPYPYLVTGVLLNRSNTSACMLTNLDFDAIDADIISQLNFVEKPDVIGYDWKEVKGDVNSGNVYYEIRPENVYFVKTQNDFIYKMRFIGFYSNSGEKGWPTIEFQKI